LVLAGQNIKIKDAVVKGDLVISSSNIVLENTVIEGNFYGNPKSVKGSDVAQSVKGKVFVQENAAMKSDIDFEKAAQKVDIVFTIASLISTLIVVGVVVYLQNKYKTLNNTKQNSVGRYFGNLGIGYAAIILPIFVFAISLFLQFYQLTGTLLIINYGLLLLSTAFTGFYLTKVLLPAFNIEIQWYHPLLISALIVLIFAFPILAVLQVIIAFTVVPATFGYILTVIWKALISAAKI
jgi:hypothetical protein